jgi:hypothetical protein
VLTDDEFDQFLQENRHAVVVFDAPWDVGPGRAMRVELEKAHERFAADVAFGEIDTDVHCRNAKLLRVENVPTVFYYRESKLIQRVVGVHEVSVRLKSLLGRRPVVHDDDFCHLYVDIRMSRERLEKLLATQLRGVTDHSAVDYSWGDLDVRKNNEYRWWKPSSSDAFLFSRYVIEVNRDERATHEEYLQGIRQVMSMLRKRRAPVVASCGFEEELDQTDFERLKAKYGD